MLDATQGREGECLANVAEAEAIARRLGVERPRKAADALGLLELGSGRPEKAIRHFEATGAAGTRLAIADLVEAYLRAQRPVPGALLSLLAQMEGDAPVVHAVVQRCRGLLARDESFERCFSAALEAYDDARMPFARARTALLYGERLRREGRRVESRRHLRDALEEFSKLDAAPWTRRSEQELRATGEALPRRDATSRDRLTSQELQVALVVARGATNKEAGAELFLSSKTIEYHLGHVYRKLEVRSRTELARRLVDEPDPSAALS
jgi:DNA-binding NarL/FixJ family response regulator